MGYTYQDALAFFGIESAHPGGFNQTKELLKQERITPYTKVLDAGCGTGRTSAYLAQTFSCQVYAVDKHKGMLNKAKKMLEQENLPVHLMEGELENLPYPSNFFDFILAESSTAFSAVPLALAEYQRVLKPGAILLTSDMTAEPSLDEQSKTKIADFYQLSYLYTEEEWHRSFQQAGFEHIQLLQAETVLAALNKAVLEEAPAPFTNTNPELEQILYQHQMLTLSYGDQLGYRIFRAVKSYS